jgi:hypothetical protein
MSLFNHFKNAHHTHPLHESGQATKINYHNQHNIKFYLIFTNTRMTTVNSYSSVSTHRTPITLVLLQEELSICMPQCYVISETAYISIWTLRFSQSK